MAFSEDGNALGDAQLSLGNELAQNQRSQCPQCLQRFQSGASLLILSTI